MQREVNITLMWDGVGEHGPDVGEDIIKQIADSIECNNVVLTCEIVTDDYGYVVYVRDCCVDARTI